MGDQRRREVGSEPNKPQACNTDSPQSILARRTCSVWPVSVRCTGCILMANTKSAALLSSVAAVEAGERVKTCSC